MSVSASIPVEGVLNCWNDEHDLPDLLLSISRAGRTGRLLFSNPEADKTLFIKQGKIVFAESSSEDDGLGQYLLRTSQISLVDYLRVSRRVEKGKRLGVLLVEEGVLEPSDLVPAVVGQVRAIILGLFRRTETWYRFKDEELSPKEAITLDMPISQLVLDGVQYVESWRRVSKGVGSLDTVYRRLADSAAEWGRLELNDGVCELLDMLKEPVSVDHICTHASLPDFDACRYIWAFRCLGWVEPVESTQPAAATPEAKLDPSVVATVPSMKPAAAKVREPAPEAPPEIVAPPDPLADDENEANDNVTAEETKKGDAPARPPAIAQHLIETRVSMDRQAPPAAAPAPAPVASPPPPPRPSLESLAKTQLAVGAEGLDEKPAEAKTPPEVPAPTPPAKKPIPKELVQTQLFHAPPARKGTEAEAPSTSEMMEAILDGNEPASPAETSKPKPAPPASTTQFFDGSSALAPPKEKPAPPSPPEPRASAATTQLFDGPSAIEPDAKRREPTPLEEDEVPYGFEALALDDEVPSPSAAATAPSLPVPPPNEEPEPGAMASFDDLAYAPEPPPASVPTPATPEPDPEPNMPIVEASIVEVADGEDPGLPVLDPEAVAEAPPPSAGGMEALAEADPFSSDGGGFSFDALPFESDDPVSAPTNDPRPGREREPTSRPPDDADMDLDADGLGQLFGSD